MGSNCLGPVIQGDLVGNNFRVGKSLRGNCPGGISIGGQLSGGQLSRGMVSGYLLC